MSGDVVFDEMASWYVEVKQIVGADVNENVVVESAGLSSQGLRGLQVSPSAGSFERPWSGRLRERKSHANSSNVQ